MFESTKNDEALVAALTRAFNDGSPLAANPFERRREIAAVAVRRIRRRRKVSIDDRLHCIRDLAKGLADYLIAESNLVGPLMKDYRFVANGSLDRISCRALTRARRGPHVRRYGQRASAGASADGLRERLGACRL